MNIIVTFSGFRKDVQYLNHLSNFQLLKNSCISYSYLHISV